MTGPISRMQEGQLHIKLMILPKGNGEQYVRESST